MLLQCATSSRPRASTHSTDSSHTVALMLTRLSSACAHTFNANDHNTSCSTAPLEFVLALSLLCLSLSTCDLLTHSHYIHSHSARQNGPLPASALRAQALGALNGQDTRPVYLARYSDTHRSYLRPCCVYLAFVLVNTSEYSLSPVPG